MWPSFAPPTPHRDEVIEVTWVDADHIPVQRAPHVAVVASHEPVTDQRVAASVTEPRAGTARSNGESDSTNANKRDHGLMSMRGLELRPDDAALERIAGAPGHEPQQAAPSGLIDDAAGGRGRIDDSVTTVEVDRDGTAHFHDKGDAEAHANLNKATVQRAAHEEANYIAAWAEATIPKPPITTSTMSKRAATTTACSCATTSIRGKTPTA